MKKYIKDSLKATKKIYTKSASDRINSGISSILYRYISI